MSTAATPHDEFLQHHFTTAEQQADAGKIGMWLFLGGSYNNHLTFDAIVIVASLLALIVLATSVEEFHPRHWILVSVVALLLVLLAALALVAYRRDLMEKAFSIQGL